MANNRVEVLRMPFHYSFTVERWYRDYSSVLIAQKSCRPFYIFSRAFAHDRIPVQYFRARPLTTVFLLARSKFDGNVPVPSHMCCATNPPFYILRACVYIQRTRVHGELT